MSEPQLKVECGQADRVGKRLVVVTCGESEVRDKLDVDQQSDRRRWRERMIAALHLSEDANEFLESEVLRAADAVDQNAGRWTMSVVAAANMEPMQTDWLWENRIPAGAITVIDGDPGTGKSQITVDLAARLSRGDVMPPTTAPDGTCKPRGALVLNAEDDPARTIRPRLDAAGADVSRVFIAREMSGADEDDARLISLPRDLPAVEQMIRQHDVGLVIVDPFVAFLDANLNANSDADIRRCLGQVSTAAETTGAAFVLVRHLNKKQGTSAMYRGGGSIGISGAARAVLAVGTDPEDPTQFVLSSLKESLCRKQQALMFSIETVGGSSRIEWGDYCDLSADDVLQSGQKSSGGKSERAKEIITDILADGPRGENEVRGACTEEGISESTYKRARWSLGILSEKTDFNGEWLLSLPSRNGAAEHDPF